MVAAEIAEGPHDGSAVGRRAATFAAGIRDLVGAESVTVRLVENGELVVVAAAGSSARALGERSPAALDPTLDRAVLSGTGELIGSVRIVLPRDAPQPSVTRQAVLDRFVEQATAAIGNAIDGARLAETTRLIRAGRRIVRQFASSSSVTGTEEALSELLCDTFGAVGLRMRFFDSDVPVHIYSRPGRRLVTDAGLHPLAYVTACRLWSRQEIVVSSIHQHINTAGNQEWLADLTTNHLSSALLVPIGYRDECLGSLVLLRAAEAPAWSAPECDAALEIGRDLGHLVRQTRARSRERRLIRELSALNAYRNGLIDTVAEQLQGPLDAIHENLDRLTARIDEDALPSQRDQVAIDTIHRSAQRMARVVDDLLLLARLAHPDHREESRDVDLKAALRRIADPMATAAARRGLAIETQLPALPVVMRGSQSDLERMLVELLSNAVKYTPRGGRITVRLGRFDDNVILTVADTGIGIPPEERTKVFDDFFRGSAPEVAAAPGSGLGLAIVDRIVRRHRGKIRFTSEVGRGTTFSIGLPVE